MDNENKIECCKCKELTEKLGASLKDNKRLAEMICNLRQENQALRNAGGAGVGCDGRGFKEKFEAQIEINHGWKKDYQELQVRFEMIKGEKRVLEEQERELKLRVDELEKRQGPLESELARLAAALCAQQGNSASVGPSEEECEPLISQMIVASL